MQKRFLFTFGTLYEPKIIKALLGVEPPHFLATVKGYAVFKGGATDLSDEIKADMAKRHDLSTCSFLFAKKVNDPRAVIQGKVYDITTTQELLLDFWERYPRWYRKEDVTIEDEKGNKHNGFMYAIDKGGEVYPNFDRVPGDINTYLEGAKFLREKIKKEFPNIEI